VGCFDDEGYLYVLNRLDDRIITGGENVEPGEVIDVLREFPSAEDAAVVGLDDDVWGERVSALLAVGDRLRDTEVTAEGPTGVDGLDESDEPDGGDDDDREPTDPDGGDESRPDENGSDKEGPDESDAAPLVDDEQLVSFVRDRLAGSRSRRPSRTSTNSPEPCREPSIGKRCAESSAIADTIRGGTPIWRRRDSSRPNRPNRPAQTTQTIRRQRRRHRTIGRKQGTVNASTTVVPTTTMKPTTKASVMIVAMARER